MKPWSIFTGTMNPFLFIIIVLPFSDCPVVAAPYECPVRSLANEGAKCTYKEIE